PPEERYPRVDVLEDVGKDDNVEVSLRNPAAYVRLEELQVRVREPISSEGDMAWVVVDADNRRTGDGDEVVRKLSLAAPDIEHALSWSNAADEEVVVVDQTVLNVDPVVVADRGLIDRAVGVVVADKKLANSAPRIGI